MTSKKLLLTLPVVVSLAVAGVVGPSASGVSTPQARLGWSSVAVADQSADTPSHTCALRTDESLWCWGANDDGQLGLGDTRVRYSPAQVGTETDWTTVAAGWTDTCALAAGSLFCWGTGYGKSPTQVGSDTDWATISVGDDFWCGMHTDGTLWCWGTNGHGQLGLGDKENRTDPTQVGTDTTWVEVSAGDVHACAVKTDGTTWCWGSGLDGELGLGDEVLEVRTPTQVGTDTDWDAVTAGTTLTCGVHTDGSGYCWGRNDRGQLGTGDLTEQTTPALVAGGESWTSIVVGNEHACGLATDDTLWCWGAGDAGQLGLGTTVDADSPTQVGDQDTWATPAAGAEDSCATQTDTTLWCWGSPDSGELGVGSRTAGTDVPSQVGLRGPKPTGQRLLGVAASAPDDVWAVGDEQVGAVTKTLIEHYDGSTWSVVRSPSPGPHFSTLYGVSALASDNAWAVGTADVDGQGRALIEHWDGTKWATVSCPDGQPEDNALRSIVAVAPDDIVAVGYDSGGYLPLIEHWDGTSWSLQNPDRGRFSWFGFSGVAALSATNIWAVGSGFVDEEAGWLTVTESWDGSAWKVRPTEHHNRFADHYFRAVTAIAHNDVWAVGDELRGSALIEHWTGHWAKLQHVPQLGGMELDGASSTGADDVWAIGKGAGKGAVLHYVGSTWSVVKAVEPTGSQFFGTTALSPTDAWIVGVGTKGALIEHWDGSSWTKSPRPTARP